MNFSFYGGLGLYLGYVKFNTLWSYTSGALWAENDQLRKAKSNALGFHGGMNLEFNISKTFAFIMGASGRTVKFSGLNADLSESANSSMSPPAENTEPNQTLWYFEKYIFGQWYPLVEIDDVAPSGTMYRNVRKAEISLGGIALKAGFKIRIK